MKIKNTIRALTCCVGAALLAITPRAMLAHHGTSGYDLQKWITLEGTVTSLDWSNPHCLLHFDAKNEAGEVQHWTIEMYNPLWMARAGWTRTSLKAGDPITITFHGSKSGSPGGYMRDGDGKLTSNGKDFSLHQGGDERGPGEH